MEVLGQAADGVSPLVGACRPSSAISSGVFSVGVLASRNMGPGCSLEVVQCYVDLTDAVVDVGVRAVCLGLEPELREEVHRFLALSESVTY